MDEEENDMIAEQGTRFLYVIGADKLRRFAVIVECWEHKNCGRVKRAWLAAFTEAERKLISNLYPRLYTWFMRRGVPIGGCEMKLKTWHTLCRAADFFASI